MRLKGKKPIFTAKDTYSLDDTLKPIIAEGLKKYLEVIMDHQSDPENQSFGIPSGILNDNNVNPTDSQISKTTEEWFLILNKMIYAFGTPEPEMGDKILDMVSSDKPNKSGHYALDIKIIDQEGYDAHIKADTIHEKNVQEGLDLFSKHFQDLWW